MITSLLFLSMQATAQATPLRPAALIGKMLEHYAKAKTCKGTITYRVSAVNETITVRTDLAYERPSKVYLHQVKDRPSVKEWTVVSDGTLFSYDAPLSIKDGRLVENVHNHGVDLTVGDIVTVARTSIADPSTPLDIAVAHLDALKYMRNQWASIDDLRPAKDGWRTIGGGWREDETQPVSAKYEMSIDKDFNLKQFVLRQTFAGARGEVVDVLNKWDIELKLDGEVDASLFTLRK